MSKNQEVIKDLKNLIFSLIDTSNSYWERELTVLDQKIDNENKELIMSILKPLGLKKRNYNIIKLIEKLSITDIPNNKEELILLPGVGNYTANAYLSLHKNVREIIIDINGVRIWSRIFNLPYKNKFELKEIYNRINEITPVNNFKDFNYAVIDFGRIICKKKPLCSKCLLNDNCLFLRRNAK